LGIRTYIPEPKRKSPWKWSERPEAERAAVTGNHRRVRGRRSKKLQRLRSEYVERSFAHVCETGGARRCWLHGLLTVSKRYLLQVAARNLGLIMRKLFGIGTPKGLQKEADLAAPAYLLMLTTWCIVKAFRIAPAIDGARLARPIVLLPMPATAA
jgi:transposase